MKKQKITLLIGIVIGVIALVIIFYFLFLREEDPSKKFAQLLAAQGIDKPNIMLITLDTTRADRLSCYGYSGVKTPHLDALANKGIVFEQCTASSPLTLPSHASMMTGMYPTYHGVRVNGNTALSDEQTTIAEVLSGQGYQCGAFIGAFVLDGRWGLKQGFQHYDDQFDLRKYKHIDLGAVQRPGNQVMNVALDWLDEQKGNPFFAWIHLYDPHAPYEPPEPYYSEYSHQGLSGLYDGEIAFMDEQIGRCVSWLEKNGLSKKTIIVLIGDHGEGLGSHGEGTHGYFIYEYAVHVPLLIIAPFPKLQGKRAASQVRAVDVYPTILELAKIESSAKTQGRSLLPEMFRPEKKEDDYAYGESMAPNIQFGWSPLYFLRTTRYKYIDAPRPELYDLTKDADEQTNLFQQYPKIAREMKDELDRLMAETSKDAPVPQAANLDKETVKRLAALGYIGAPVSAKKSSSGGSESLADPKDKLQVFASIHQAGELLLNDQYALAAEKLEAALLDEPTIPQALLQLSTCYVELGRNEEAKAKLDAVLKDDPENVQALISLANILLREGKEEDVIALCQQTLSVDDKNVQAYMLIGEVYIGKLNHTEALPYLENAVEIQPKLTRNRLNLAACLVGVKQYDRAETMLKEIIRDYPKSPRAKFNLGLLYEDQGRLEEAKIAYAEEVSAFPREFQARFNLGKVLLELGDKAGYMENMREVVKIAPKRAEGYLFLARGLLLEQAPLDEVKALLEKGLSHAETPELKALGYFLLADVYNRQHLPQKMNEALQKANSYKPKKE
ncbi:MAG: sulfatase-like hydrolase/transferase [Candidatus Aminicenantes bacterium]|nr:sulfatase-like hydrolase/transferase [Candidatus Aminicenantes bacterium]MDH5742615.1 sulfatase-like hydrolase/transferase [Candidatus Aminicenantes bacterium]